MATVFSEIENSMDSAIERIKVTFEKPDMKVVFGLWKVYLHSSIIGSIVGVLPGAGATIASFICYSEARRVSKHKELFGKGSLEGVAAPECGNNAVVGASLIRLLTLGIPSSATASVLVGALMLHNIQPGPLLFQTNGDIVYGIFAGVVMSSVAQLVFGLIGIPVWVKVISAPKPILLAVITVLSVIGSYGFNNSIVDVWIMLGFGVLGYVLTKINFPVTPIVLGLVLGGMMEENYRRALMVSGGDHSIFITHPISAGLLIVAALSLLSPLLYKKIIQPTNT